MNNNAFLNQQFRLQAQNSTPIPTPTPTPSQTPSTQTPRSRVETPIHPPQIPPQSTPTNRSRQQQQQQQKRLQQLQQRNQQQQHQQQQQQHPRYNVQAAQLAQPAQQTQTPQPDLTPQPPLGPPTAAFHASRLPPQPDLSDVLAAQVVREQEALEAAQLPIEPVFHRVGDPPQAPPKGKPHFQPQYGTYNAMATPQAQHARHVQAQQAQQQAQQAQQAHQAQQIMQLAQANQYSPGPTPQGTPNTSTRQGPTRTPAQQQHGQDQDADPSSQLHDESMQGLEEEMYDQDQDDDDQDMDDGSNNQGGGGDANGENTGFNTDPSVPLHVAPLMLPITDLQLPTVRPTLKLGPYDKREEAMETVQEYAIVQGYVLVLTGCAKQKTPAGKYTGESEVVRVDLMCDRGGICKNSGTGKRKRPTHKIGCPARIKLVCRKRQASKWFIEIRCEEHNHDLDPSKMHTIAAYRRWRRVQAGGPSVEPLKERHERSRKPKVMPPVPPPKFHQVGGLHSQPPANPTSPLHMAALKGQCKIIDILLNKGADINNLDQTGRTPLHCAVEGERMDAVTKLMERGADVTVKDVKGISALAMAVEKGMEDAVVLFIEAGADPNV